MSLNVRLQVKEIVDVYSGDITHNMGRMANECGVYEACWRPEELGHKKLKAKHIIPILEKGIEELESWPEYYKQFNPENGGGDYYSFLEWLASYLTACKIYPNAKICIWR